MAGSGIDRMGEKEDGSVVRERVPDADASALPLYRIDTERIARFALIVLVACELALVLLDATLNRQEWSHVGSIRRLVNITREDGIGNWFASCQELLVAMVCGIVFVRMRVEATRRVASRGWAFLALFFLYVSFDDGTKFHERIGSWIKETTSNVTDGGAGLLVQRILDAFPSYTWQVVFLPFFAAAGVFVLVFLWRTFAGTGLRPYVVGGLGCFAAAVLLDWVEGLDDGWGFVSRATRWSTDAVEHYGKSLEEFIEMFGTTLFLVAFLRYLGRVARGWRLEL